MRPTLSTDKQSTESNSSSNDGFTQMQTLRSLPFTLLRARVAVMMNFTQFLASHNKTEQQWRVLRLLGVEEAMDATRLAERACILAPSLTRIIKTLTNEGLIKSERDPDDGRRIRLTITAAGEDMMSQSMSEALSIYRHIIDTFGADNTENLLDLLEGLEKALLEAEADK